MGYTTIRVSEEVRDKLQKAAEMMNVSRVKGTHKVTVAGLVTMLAAAYANQMDETVLSSTDDDERVLSGSPVILDSDAQKYFVELKGYEPVNCVAMVTQFIRNTAMEKRFMQTGVSNGK